MIRVTVCLGILFAIVTSSYAQDSSSDTLKPVGQTAGDDNSRASASNSSQTKTQTQDHEATAASSKQNDQLSSGNKIHLRLGGIVVSGGYTHFWPGIYPYGFQYGPFYSPISAP